MFLAAFASRFHVPPWQLVLPSPVLRWRTLWIRRRLHGSNFLVVLLRFIVGFSLFEPVRPHRPTAQERVSTAPVGSLLRAC